MPRPSSPLSAKASTRCPSFALERHTQRQESHRVKPKLHQRRHAIESSKTLRRHIDGTHQQRAKSPPSDASASVTIRFFTIVHQQNAVRTALLRGPFSGTANRFPAAISPGLEVVFGGGERDRTVDLLLAKQALSQLSYTPVRNTERQKSEQQISAVPRFCNPVDLKLVGQGGFEPPTSRLSSARSNQLSY